MNTGIYVFVIGVTLASARHTSDESDVARASTAPDHDSDRRHSESVGREAAVDHHRANRPPHHSDRRYVTESDHVALISKRVDSSNNIGNDDNEFRLRTNLHTSKSIDPKLRRTSAPHIEGERRSEPGGAVARVAPQRDADAAAAERKGAAHAGGGTSHGRAQADRDNARTGPKPDAADAADAADASPTGKAKTSAPADADAEAEAPWVWGQPAPQQNATDGGLDDRAAFDGKLCPSGYIKVMGVCLETH